MKKIIETIKTKWMKDTLKTIIMIIILFVIFIGINVLIQKLDLTDIDVTRKSIIYLIRNI